MPVSEAQRRASDKWAAKNKDKQRYYAAKSTAKRFISKLAKEQDLDEMVNLINQRQEELKYQD
ncbi:MAG: hypothetical protein LKF01_01145 [Lactobacillus sp.]|jgi:hypothetical protein|nr:hypothetical protein [Lactobacillus sp.]MCH4068145.1 hypothetical protein [Lactobacillus sp.]MCI1304326.1 hypothetical protein [Lactobacillus sp.]MCI1330075.1 hypothetical protein [Lactobacillus sp.]MCI1399675.1 hypothetical protein [Lactobacillus sp.]